MTKRYNLKNIRTFLTEGFRTEELRRFCFDELDFRPVYDHLAENSGKAEIIDQLLEHAGRKRLLDKLLTWAKESNPAEYEEHQPYYDTTNSSTTSNNAKSKAQRAKEIKSVPLKLKNVLSSQVWGGIAGVVTILALCWSIYTFIILPPNPTPTSIVVMSTTPTVTTTPIEESTATSLPVLTETPIPSPAPSTGTPSPTPTNVPVPTPIPLPPPTTPTGNLAVPVVFNFGTKVYLTGFDGAGINGPNPISLDARQPMFSHDGQFIMVKATIDGVTGLYKLTASGFSPQTIINRGSAEWPVLSLDGKTIMFSEATLNDRLHRRLPSDELDTPDKNIEEVFFNNSPVSATNLLWSEDNQLVFQSCATWLNEPDNCGIWVTPANDLYPQRVIQTLDAYPMSARAGLLSYMSQEDGDWEIYMMPLNGGPAVKLTDNDFEDGLPVISPDGNMIAYISKEFDKWGVWTMNLDGQNKQWMFDIDPGRGTIDPNQWQNERMSWRR